MYSPGECIKLHEGKIQDIHVQVTCTCTSHLTMGALIMPRYACASGVYGSVFVCVCVCVCVCRLLQLLKDQQVRVSIGF